MPGNSESKENPNLSKSAIEGFLKAMGSTAGSVSYTESDYLGKVQKNLGVSGPGDIVNKIFPNS